MPDGFYIKVSGFQTDTNSGTCARVLVLIVTVFSALPSDPIVAPYCNLFQVTSESVNKKHLHIKNKTK